jgi:hypothetical protein
MFLIPIFLFFSVASYLSWSLLGAFRVEFPFVFGMGVVILLGLFAAQAWLILLFFQSSADEKLRFEKPLQKIAFHGMGIISFLFTFTLIRDLCAIPFRLSNRGELLYGVGPSSLILLISFILLMWGMWNARFKVTSPKITIPVKGLPNAISGLRIVQLSDVHLGNGPSLIQVRELVDRALSLNPDLIVLTGDIIDGAVTEIQPELAELARLKVKYGTWFVLGNHECYWNHETAVSAIKAAGITPLLNEGVKININGETLYIAGVNDPAITHFKGQGPVIPTPPEDSAFRLLLAHQPQIADRVAEFSYHLQLSGHTHGGQFFPWNLFVNRMYRHPGGLHRLKELWIYVSHGSGFWGPPIRLGTDGEVTELLLTGKTR